MYVSYMESRQRGNPAGNTNAHVAANLRSARQAIGMDLRTFSERVKETGRAMSPSALSKIENGDRRVDVDDLTVFAYILQTTPATLLAPPEGASPPTGVPSGQYNLEEIQAWVRGQAEIHHRRPRPLLEGRVLLRGQFHPLLREPHGAVRRGRQGQPDAPQHLRGAVGLIPRASRCCSRPTPHARPRCPARPS